MQNIGCATHSGFIHWCIVCRHVSFLGHDQQMVSGPLLPTRSESARKILAPNLLKESPFSIYIKRNYAFMNTKHCLHRNIIMLYWKKLWRQRKQRWRWLPFCRQLFSSCSICWCMFMCVRTFSSLPLSHTLYIIYLYSRQFK